MRSHASPTLTDLHAVMDEVSALQQAAPAQAVQRQHLAAQVRETYARLGVEVDPALIEQAVANRLAPVSDEHEASVETTFGFGWNRPSHAGRWKHQLSQRRRFIRLARGALGGASSVAFCVWLWMVLGTVPAALDHPWWFAILCMMGGSGLESWIEVTARRNRQWEAARKPSRKQLRQWSQSPRALAYLGAVLDSSVPLLNADLPLLRQLAKQDEQRDAVRRLVR